MLSIKKWLLVWWKIIIQADCILFNVFHLDGSRTFFYANYKNFPQLRKSHECFICSQLTLFYFFLKHEALCCQFYVFFLAIIELAKRWIWYYAQIYGIMFVLLFLCQSLGFLSFEIWLLTLLGYYRKKSHIILFITFSLQSVLIWNAKLNIF